MLTILNYFVYFYILSTLQQNIIVMIKHLTVVYFSKSLLFFCILHFVHSKFFVNINRCQGDVGNVNR